LHDRNCWGKLWQNISQLFLYNIKREDKKNHFTNFVTSVPNLSSVHQFGPYRSRINIRIYSSYFMNWFRNVEKSEQTVNQSFGHSGGDVIGCYNYRSGISSCLLSELTATGSCLYSIWLRMDTTQVGVLSGAEISNLIWAMTRNFSAWECRSV
jgi:hypothetical protein